MNVSVAMAVYQGAKYLKEQIDSILIQLDAKDELVISYDVSKDDTLALIMEYAKQDERVSVLHNMNPGVLGNFENALSHCQNELIFLADQDDIWMDTKVAQVKKAMQDAPNTMVLMHDCTIVNEMGEIIESSFFKQKKVKHGFVQNIMINSFIGCCMVVRKELLQQALPFPKTIPMHDQWLGLIGEKQKQVIFLEQSLLQYRRHGNNASTSGSASKAGIKQMLQWRIGLIRALKSRGIL